MITINSLEAEEDNISTLNDLNRKYPDMLDSIVEFYRMYKVPAGKPENKFAFDGEIKDDKFASTVIR